MVKVPSLLCLTMETLKTEFLHEDDLIEVIYNEMPPELFDIFLTHLPPLALQKLQREMPFKYWNEDESTYDCLEYKRKRGRRGKINQAWKELVKKRWPQIVNQNEPIDWEQVYWEAHLQSCLDEAAELASLPSFNGRIGDIKISGTLLKYIGYEEQMSHSACDYSKLSCHCQQFGFYARNIIPFLEHIITELILYFTSKASSIFSDKCLRLQNVLCVAETCQLLRNCMLQSLVIWLVRSAEHVDGLCKLLIQNIETLTSLEFHHCKLCSYFVNSIRCSLCNKSMQPHRIQHFSVNASEFFENGPSSLALDLMSFLSAGRSLQTLKFHESHLDRNFGRMVLSILLEASSCISTLDLSGNNVTGWLAKCNRSPGGPLLSLGVVKSLQSLRILNLRGNNLHKADAEDLRYALFQMPNLESLDIGENPIEDDGIRRLIPYFAQASARCNPLTVLNLENCELSSNGVTELVDMLSTLRRPLNSLSIADNNLGSQVAATLGKILGTSVQELNLGGIGLGLFGFRDLQDQITKEMKLVNINISKNRGGIETAKFLSKLLPRAPELVEVDASYNLMPLESLNIICSILKDDKGRLERLDLTGNNWDCQQSHASMLAEFQHKGRPILILPSLVASNVLYDDDP